MRKPVSRVAVSLFRPPWGWGILMRLSISADVGLPLLRDPQLEGPCELRNNRYVRGFLFKGLARLSTAALPMLKRHAARTRPERI